MGTYGYLMIEVRRREGWKHLIWKSDAAFYDYSNIKEEEDDKIDNIHKYYLVDKFYGLRDSLTNGDFGHTSIADDFTEEVKNEIEYFKENFGWYEGYFTMLELDSYITKKEKELDDMRQRNFLQAIYDEVRGISAKLNGKSFEKKDEEETPFDRYYTSDLEYIKTEISTLRYIATCGSYLVDEACGYVPNEDIRIIVIGA